MASNDNNITIGIGTKVDKTGIEDVNKSVDSMSDKFKDGMKKVAVATGVAGVALTAYSKSAVNSLQDTVRSSKALSTQTGLTVEESSRLVAVFNRMGVSSDQTSAAFRKLSKDIVDNNSNVDNASNPLNKLGIQTKDATGKTRDFNAILLDISDKFKAMPDGVEKTTTAVDLFGKSGGSMIKILNKGSDGIKELENQAEKLGLTLNSKNIKAIDDYTKSQKDLTASSAALKVQVGTLTAPVLTEFNNKINQVTSALINTQTPFHTAIVDTLAFGGPVLTATAAVAGFASNVVGAWPAIVGFGARMVTMANVSVTSLSRIGVAMTELDVLLTAPIIMPAIVVAAALASLAVVYAKGQETLNLLDKLNKQEAQDSASTTSGLQSIINSYKSGKISKATEQKLLNGLAGNNAVGSNRWSGGWSWVGENGPELLNLPGGTQIKDAKTSQTMATNNSSTTTMTVGTVVLQSADAVKEFFKSADADSLLASNGFATNRGAI